MPKKMFFHLISTTLLLKLLLHDFHVNAEAPSSIDDDNLKGLLQSDLSTCETQLSKYRQFLLQAIVRFEDVCDAYNTRPPALTNTGSGSNFRATPPQSSGTALFPNYKPPARRSDIWAFFKLLMAQFNDVEFAGVIRDAIIERCRIKAAQHDDKRNSMVLGKKQRFHSWGGKRAFTFNDNKNDADGGSSALQGYFLEK